MLFFPMVQSSSLYLQLLPYPRSLLSVGTLLILVVFCMLPCATLAQQAEKGPSVEPVTYRSHLFQIENDVRITDEQYTSGLRYARKNLHTRDSSLEARRPFWLRFVDDCLDNRFSVDDNWLWTTGWSLSQNFYTPTVIDTSVFIPNDRPYAGWLHWASTMEWTKFERTVQTIYLELDLGVVGPISLSGSAQRIWHEQINSEDPEGWHHQVKRLAAIALRGYYQRGFSPRPDSANWRSDGSFFVEGTVGSVFNQASLGGEARLGYHLSSGFAQKNDRPTVTNVKTVSRSDQKEERPSTEKREAYGFLRAEVRAVASNYLIEGGDRHTIEMRHGIFDFNAGLALRSGRYLITLQQIVRSPEFTPSRWHRFNSISLIILP
jgi:hypothetical protein